MMWRNREHCTSSMKLKKFVKILTIQAFLVTCMEYMWGTFNWVFEAQSESLDGVICRALNMRKFSFICWYKRRRLFTTEMNEVSKCNNKEIILGVKCALMLRGQLPCFKWVIFNVRVAIQFQCNPLYVMIFLDTTLAIPWTFGEF